MFAAQRPRVAFTGLRASQRMPVAMVMPRRMPSRLRAAASAAELQPDEAALLQLDKSELVRRLKEQQAQVDAVMRTSRRWAVAYCVVGLLAFLAVMLGMAAAPAEWGLVPPVKAIF
ncbi:hypothetical protein HYH02_008425 [Chlamydomonas schloesseri]|uniref:Uncharacterized protein n=1 Tax=Chlamydomonas schloesseri TaxID=2026947 RepID=A0A835WFK2_9CHLO|nr:hypothetical protein HYH02_008425 [Chlamydomonas schloesseri]|eukprot:KAG2446433.1 hypothetical protein HYH02_008425 [Chlamydomonas schloesseri]